MNLSDFQPYLVAAAIGLGVGFEREYTHRKQEIEIVGSRTFAVIALSGVLARSMSTWMAAAGLVALAIVLAVELFRTPPEGRGGTTETAALATYLLGALTWTKPELAVGLAVLMVVLLISKQPIHRLSRELITKEELEDALRFFVIAFVILPLLPNREAGPYGVLNPHRIWFLVVALTGIGSVGYIAVRALGAKRGLIVTGFAGGFISASATIVAMGTVARKDDTKVDPAIAGSLAASAATLVQLSLVVGVVNSELLWRLAVGIGLGLVTFVAEIGWWLRQGVGTDADAQEKPGRAFAIRPALILGGLLTLILLLTRWGSDQLGSSGALIVGGIAGFADVHAAIVSLASLAKDVKIDVHTALLASALALLANTIVKSVVAYTAGGTRFGNRVTLLLIVPTIATGAGFALRL